MMPVGLTILGRYKATDIVAYGGQAIFAKGIDLQTRGEVGIKQLAVPDDAVNFQTEHERFLRHARIRVVHPNVVDPIDSGEECGEQYIIMPFIEGPTLTQFAISYGGKLPPEIAVYIVIEIAKALGACHAAGIIHRDIKPQNVILEQGQYVRLVDFGIARVVTEQTITTCLQDPLGTFPYIPREQITDPTNADHRADLYSLGIILYELLSGQLPFLESDPAKLEKLICNAQPSSLKQLNSTVPAHIEQACMQLLAKQPEARLQSTEDVIQALQGDPIITIGNTQSNACHSCGRQEMSDAKFCGKCGAFLQTGIVTPSRCIACGVEAENISVCSNCRRPFSPADHKIEFTQGALTGLVFRIPEGIYCVGRNELSPRVCQISRSQFMVSCNNGTVMVEDAKSLNKTHVAGRILESSVMLANGQLIAFGENIGTYLSH